MPEISVVVPAYRERENLPVLIAALEEALRGHDWEAIIVIDDAGDESEFLVREHAQQNARVRCMLRIGRRGLASACIEGMLSSSAPYLAVIDADLQHDERSLPDLIAAIKGSDADVAVASRYVTGASTGDLPRHRVFMSRLATGFSRLLGVTLSDPMSGYFVVSRAYLDSVVRRLYGRGFKILLDLISAAGGRVRVVEIPYRMRSRAHGESKMGFRVISEFLALVLYRLCGRLFPARFFLFLAVGLSGMAVHLAVLSVMFSVSAGDFLLSQATAIAVAMTGNFFLNNVFTYGDRRLRGAQMWRGLLAFYAACSLGALINVSVADWLFLRSVDFRIAGVAGAAVAAIWNFLTTASVTWGNPGRKRQ
ncbi:MAG: glycosyltransferase family 2 protein [Gammaproteobacteria bacterium]|nr:glycosyltransferase family 2 protein [Gammaproteobacteria bacterium]MCG3142855.1 Undecaprenyl-phosphate 4-deoxy-4-formamido-L-arabinose transferase [Gammaproteobacteria bacterium]